MDGEYPQNRLEDRTEFNKEVDEYVARFRNKPREDILKYIWEISSFFYKCRINKERRQDYVLEEISKL